MENAKTKTTEQTRSLAAKIAAISAEIGTIAKDGRNQEQGYSFIEYASVAGRIRSLQSQHGVSIVPHVEDYTVNEVQNKYGKIGYHYILKMKFKVINADNQNDFIEAQWLGESTDYGDKGINKAETSATKYFIMRLYNISEKGEEEADSNTPDQFNNSFKSKSPVKKPQTNPDNTKSKIDFKKLSAIRAKLPLINEVAKLEVYRRQLKLDDRHWALLKGDFAKRKKEIEDGME